jgi:threonine/homoserine/homoserine lactone efflux protein
MIDDIQAAIPLGFFLAFMIGPVFFVLIETSVTKGFRAAVAFDLGVIIADIIFIGVAYFSTILAVYGLIIFLKKPKRNDLKAQLSNSFKVNYIELFIKGFLLNFINVGVLIFWLGIIIVTGPSLENDINRFYVFFGSLIVAYFITDLFKILLAKQLKKQLTPKIILKIKKLLGIILLICGMVLITKGFLPKDKLNPQTIIEEIRE